MTLTFSQVGAPNIIEIVSKTVTGPLRFELERFIEGVIVANQVARNATPSADVRDHLAAQFLNSDESAALRDDLERRRQSAYEPTAQYAIRFRGVADIAYPTGQRNVDQERLLIKSFARGLTSDELARKLVEQANPTNIEEAMTAVTRFCERKDAYKRLCRQEEPMEVGVMRECPSENALPLATMINSLSATVAKLATKVAKIEMNSQTRTANCDRQAPTHENARSR